MKERLFYDITQEEKKKFTEALKNEFKLSKQIPIFNERGDTIAYANKYEIYYDYIDFYLTECIPDLATKQLGKIQHIELAKDYAVKNNKVTNILIDRIGSITA